MKLKSILPHLIILLAAFVYTFVMSSFGVGIFADSVFFYQAADNILKHNGIVDYAGNLINHWPPLYAIVLALIKKITGANLSNAAFYLNIISIIGNGYLFWLVLKTLKLKENTIILSLFSLLFSIPFSTTYTMFLSETLFIPLFLATMLFFLKWINEKKLKFLIIAGCFSGLCFLTRYATAGIVAGIMIYILFSKPRKKLQTLFNLAFYTIPIILCYMVWNLYCYSKMETGNDRDLVFHIIDSHKIFTTVKTIIAWGIGSSYQFVLIGVIAFATLITLSLRIIYKTKNQFGNYISFHEKHLKFLLTSIVVYYSFIVGVICLIDASTPIDQRILMPMYLFSVLVFAIILNYVLKKHHRTNFIIPICIIAISILSGAPKLLKYYREGYGYTGKTYEGITIPDNIDFKNKEVYTNDVAFLIFSKRIMPKQIPMKRDLYNLTVNMLYNQQLDSIQNEINNKKSVILFFDTREELTPLFPTKTELQELFNSEQIENNQNTFVIQ
ncbi:Dolichyl-phosphate-mannose-protein mannosyltransferase [Pustulibacterium marinum]|uniref:Dolichyl-phosphate-mannose-protein mannosyltransferase n=1 Tax=Pustulibacterium marinum TaxID=1224947 RepID=A0A1I7G5Y7_9FLAO|nr:glycosyltransferase family 39 protein [Pustulibacterium marinum]SFU43882.1 Dolichyl-phosphate-mannose-protein mannosyltransferase [Pustulibacterium marinum]